ncbi:MAG TPA: 5-formyltetrahydrofolate cyclo-ligase [Nitrososphaera sp.]|nr:5-formyltetrahydrofolate cyclo-ligase [Nitrososphaera sp.]
MNYTRKEKQKVRRAALARRDAMSYPDIERQSALVQQSVARSKEFGQAQVVGAYHPKGSEVRTALLMGIAKDQGKKVVLPRIEGNDMRFYEYDLSGDSLVEGRFGIMEPTPEAKPVMHIDLLLVPGLAFDCKGNRIGYGRGYYDRFISGGGASFSMGLAYSVQVATDNGDDDNPGLPRGRFDRRLDALATENGVLYF